MGGTHSNHFHSYIPLKYTCPWCEQRFSKLDCLEQHCLKLGENHKYIPKPGKLVCVCCKQNFATLQDFVHHKETSRKCFECGECFADSETDRYCSHLKDTMGRELEPLPKNGFLITDIQLEDSGSSSVKLDNREVQCNEKPLTIGN